MSSKRKLLLEGTALSVPLFNEVTATECFPLTIETHKRQRVLINTGLQPGDSRSEKRKTVSTVFPAACKPLKRLVFHTAFHTRLKPGVNEISQSVFYFASFTFGL